MNKLSGLDATFLYLEAPEMPMHIAGLSICEPPEGYNADPVEQFRAQIAECLSQIPSFHRALAPTPMGIDHPVWSPAPTVDLDYHVQRATLPEPGTMDQLRALIEELHSTLLDRSRPLWQFHVIEGLEGGRFALYTKSHHAGIDGESGVAITEILADDESIVRPVLNDRKIDMSAKQPGAMELLTSAYTNFLDQQIRIIEALPQMTQAFGNMARMAFKPEALKVSDLTPAPRTPFNARMGRERSYGITSIPFLDIRAVGKATGTTINDVVLAISAGTLRRYLSEHKALPREPLVAAVPVSLREVGNTDNNNQVTGMLVSLATDIEDPVERLKAINAASARAKAQLGTVKDVVPQDFSFFGAPLAMTLMGQVASGTPVMDQMPAVTNVCISNVPGRRVPMYFAGA
jgi:WS/DGAT/MGAT family acyltransferase